MYSWSGDLCLHSLLSTSKGACLSGLRLRVLSLESSAFSTNGFLQELLDGDSGHVNFL